MTINIRKEEPADIDAIHKVTTAAFLNAPHTDYTEQFIVDALRKSEVLTISLVAEEQNKSEEQVKIVGHVAVSPVTISDGTESWYGLGPISVHPDQQDKGIGLRLMKAAIEQLKHINAKGCVLLGDPDYYQRFGFEPKAGLILPDVPPEYFQALMIEEDKLLQNKVPQGEVVYHDSFSAKE